ncbi:uncharacterized protein LOC101848518 [Aplysia californica]|uniref:Uncharacterized protein LOC101848518 n=1 Tax=Aplysia californica TaxID=6500 RepID=A0ABM0ZZH4_APLCA|nr:uncharacterized protein LOC101848518 [Aplysia californica]
MAQYASLWTSSRDPEFQHMKKVKQLTERNLSIDLAKMELKHKRTIRKVRSDIRENMTILDELNREKRKRARLLLATFLRHHSKKQARRWMARTGITGRRPASDDQHYLWHTKTLGQHSNTPAVSPVSPSNQQTLPWKPSRALSPANADCNTKASELTKGNVRNSKKFGNNLEVPSYKGSWNLALKRPSIDKMQRANPSNKSNLPTQDSRNTKGREQIQGNEGTQQKKKKVRIQDHLTMSRYVNSKGQVMMTHTFPFVYHSDGYKPCDRYGLFRECTDLDPYKDDVTSRRGSNAPPGAGRKSFSEVTELPVAVRERGSSLQRITLAVAAIRALGGKH